MIHSQKLTFSPLKKGTSFSKGLFSGALAVSFREGTCNSLQLPLFRYQPSHPREKSPKEHDEKLAHFVAHFVALISKIKNET